jgi:hypothetical protein
LNSRSVRGEAAIDRQADANQESSDLEAVGFARQLAKFMVPRARRLT